MPKLYIFSGYGHNQSFEFVGSSIYIGRSEENDIQISDLSVSRRHLQIIEKDNRLFVKDLNSRNGTYINGSQITPDEYYEINENYPIVIGMTLICLGEKCLDSVAGLIDSLSHSSVDNDDQKGTTFLRPLTQIRNNEFISNINNIFHVSSNVKEVLEKILDHIMNHFVRVDRVVILIFTEGVNGVITETVVSRSRVNDSDHDKEFSRLIVDRVITSRTPLVVPNIANEKEIEITKTLRFLKIGSVMCAPIMKGNKLMGIIYIDSYEKPYGFRGDDLKLINEVSDLTAESINSYLM